jgi:hypothetical protein
MGRVKDLWMDQQVLREQQMREDCEMNSRELELESDFHQALSALVMHLKQKMQERGLSRFRFDIEMQGGTDDEQVRVRFMAGENYDASNAQGGSLIAVVDEFCRRKGWADRHAILQLTDDRQVAINAGPVPQPADKPVPGIDRPGEEPF